MTTRTKTFDCVEMKRQCQDKLMKEYESRKGEFDSFLDFIRAKAHESDWVSRQRKRLRNVR